MNIPKLIKRISVYEYIYAAAFALMCITSRHIVDQPTDRTTILTTYITPFGLVDVLLFLLIFVAMIAILELVQAGLAKIDLKAFKKANSSLPERSTGTGKYYLWLIIFASTMLLWIPYLMSYWPGGIYNDTLDSIHIALGKADWSNQNTVLYALWWRLIFFIGQVADQGDYGGLKLMTIVQSIIMAVVSASFFTWLYRRGSRLWIVVLGAASVALFPIFPFYAVSMWKDTLFSVNMFLYTWLLFVIIEKCHENKEAALTIRNIMLYTILSLLIIFGRNNGIYIFVITAIFFCIAIGKTDRIKLVGLSLGILILSLVIQGPVYSTIGVEQPNASEKYGIPLQQVGYMISNNARMSDSEKVVMENMLTTDGWINLYSPTVVDTIKFDPLFNTEYLNDHQGEFLTAYLGMTLKNPGLAIKGYLLATIGFWDAWKSSSSAYICTAHCWNAEYFLSDYFSLYTGITLSDIVGPRWYISTGLLGWILLGIMAIVLADKARYNRTYIVPMLPTLALWLTLLIATPLAFSFRYVFSLLLCMPIYLLILFKREHEETTDTI